MNLEEARRQLEQLKTQARAINAKLSDPGMKAWVGLKEWPFWEGRQKRQLRKVEADIRDTKAQIKRLSDERAQDRQTRMMNRQKALESKADPLLAMLADMHRLIVSLRNDGVDLDPEEHAIIDQVGVYLKTELGLSSRGNGHA